MKHHLKFLPINSCTPIQILCTLFLAFAGMVGLSCRSDSGPTTVSLNATLGIGDFPMSVGDTWTYIAYDSLTNTIDTVSVAITAASSTGQMVWVFWGGRYNDTLYVFASGNTLLMYHDPFATQLATTIQFPLVAGSSWGNAVESNVVRTESNVVVPAGVVGSAFRIDRHDRGLNYSLDSRTWICSGIGIVRLERKELNLGPVMCQRWDLLRFQHIH